MSHPIRLIGPMFMPNSTEIPHHPTVNLNPDPTSAPVLQFEIDPTLAPPEFFPRATRHHRPVSDDLQRQTLMVLCWLLLSFSPSNPRALTGALFRNVSVNSSPRQMEYILKNSRISRPQIHSHRPTIQIQFCTSINCSTNFGTINSPANVCANYITLRIFAC